MCGRRAMIWGHNDFSEFNPEGLFALLHLFCSSSEGVNKQLQLKVDSTVTLD